LIEEWREMPLQELVALANTTAETLRRLEDKGLVHIGSRISERDPYAREQILPTQALPLNAEQAAALAQRFSPPSMMRARPPVPRPTQKPIPKPGTHSPSSSMA
jgi:hypothetical protein